MTLNDNIRASTSDRALCPDPPEQSLPASRLPESQAHGAVHAPNWLGGARIVLQFLAR
jgi:hypothetical protein